MTDHSAAPPTMQIATEGEFDFLSVEYREFYNPLRGSAFQAPLWMDRVHRCLCAALNGTQHTVTIRDCEGTLLAVMPLVRQKAMGITILQPADFGVCDYNCVVADQDFLSMLCKCQLARRQLEHQIQGCDLVLFRKVREDAFDVGRLFANLKSSVGENAAYHSDVGDTFDQWKNRTVRKKFSKELGRLQRQIEREFGCYEHRPAASEAEVRAAFDFLRTARRGRFRRDLLDNDIYFEFYRDYAVAACPCGEAITYVSYVAGKPIAVLFGLVGDGNFHAVLIGSDQVRFGKHSPGTQIIYQIIRRRFADGHRHFDMGIGNNGYKTHFRVAETQLRNYTRAVSLSGSAVAICYHHAKPVKNFLSRFAPNVR
jgi:CelD/BcsL family acetyltransferase involved in cellulose biosynthesis